MVLPPVGMMAFVGHKIINDPSIGTVYRGCLPFAVVLMVIEALIIAFPEIVLFLPNTMIGK
jgi:TRAP-type C4-dicarboxylate transport system permease large subunit